MGFSRYLWRHLVSTEWLLMEGAEFAIISTVGKDLHKVRAQDKVLPGHQQRRTLL